MDFQINGVDYKAGKLDAKKQFHIIRRLAPVMAGLTGAKDGADFLSSIAVALGSLSDADSDYVLFGLLGCVERSQPGHGWARVSINDALMFDDIDIGVMLQIAVKAFQGNFEGFFKGIGSLSSGATPTQNDQ